MISKQSRYRNLPRFSPAGDERPTFPGLRARRIGTATPVIEHEIAAGDRLDHLAQRYYNDDRMWWRIVDANPQYLFAGNVWADDLAGEVLLIPRAQE
ncbi:MAG: hypothetical protein Tsb002_21230 [Wenzhouxiangellaceae bacterium]